ncbi:VPLPA-CTERM sorting domain-containing protein [Paracraurococcus lichenis]|uniref:VPLPA-CTERM sorting domain-containing protein n=1 Tax=Paracraurococcus lichenis TaxID=3064888 RepID=A0ABT9DZD9_9PROT|nr:VPLPA-CTERM sorting domain-containing protein [Paracraurococcus sp. LOR1-02]MDO9709273.1 VPLPA-CTERM sorting domain-containing protein [Paracraurococcus sp. LOR1-02]
MSASRLALLLAAGLAIAAPAAAGTITYQFEGLCTACSTAAGHDVFARATLTLQDSYVLGDPLAPSFVSFHYDGTNLLGAFTITPVDSTPVLGHFETIPGPALMSIDDRYGNYFETRLTGVWDAGGSAAVSGTLGTWSAVPEPAAFTLLLGGLAGLAATRRRKA